MNPKLCDTKSQQSMYKLMTVTEDMLQMSYSDVLQRIDESYLIVSSNCTHFPFIFGRCALERADPSNNPPPLLCYYHLSSLLGGQKLKCGVLFPHRGGLAFP
ncbi:hypothetical protein EYF80_011192 [Liparis tanakae]|uniref:Uncharacterized protein n=1 Tax=Liparis tanakae TaxID=230148 RepID=A0A4Z2ILG1_9TELE|nr:hypothetical protein EYF80_011192 [Liparis tanakae]